MTRYIYIFFSSFLKFSLLYYVSFLMDVFNNGFLKKTLNDLVPGLNPLEQAVVVVIIRDLKIRRRRQQRKHRLKSEFAFI